ncbi:MAG TPA: hypothetical protein VF848_09925 [Steroidobacteraceae bacterium]
MYGSLYWIEWLDRLDRVLTSTRRDIAALTRAVGPRSIEAIERSKRQLAALTKDLGLLDTDVLSSGPEQSVPNGVDNLQKALELTIAQLGRIAELLPAGAPAVRDRVLAAVDSALRDSCYEAAMLLAPSRRRPATAGPGAHA